jgi:PAS domain S-box-containing protein
MTESPPALYARHLARVVESSDDAIISKDLNGTVLSWNGSAERMFGYTEAEMVGRSIRVIIPDALQSEEDSVLERIRAGDTVDHYETIRQRKDGTLLNISLTVSPIRDEDGIVIGASKIARDITETTRLLALAREHAAITERLNQVGTMLASNLDRDTIVQKVTDVARELTGAQFGAFFYNVVDEGSKESYQLYTLSGAAKEAFAESPDLRATAIFGPTFRGEAPVRLDDVTTDPHDGWNGPFHGMPEGQLPVKSYLAVPVKDRSGRVLGGLVFGHERVGVFNEHHERLAVGIASWATVALENARLYVDAQEASRMKDDFLAVLSHELRTPLNAIVGYARLLRGGLLTEEKAQRGLEAVDRNATWLTQIVEDVLDVSRIVSGNIRMDVQAVEVALVVHNAVATVQPAADAKGVRVETIVDPHAGPVAGDKDRLQQVIWNLLSNAVKFTPRGGRVQVRLERVNSHIEMTVADTGIGIPHHFLPHVFERFSQAESGTTRKTGGLGLGLAIARHIVEMHGGTIEATSGGENEGATFRVCLPMMIVHAKTPAAKRQHPRVEQPAVLAGLANLAGIRILAVDDEEDSLALLRTVLETAGAQVTTVSSPTKALERIADVRPQVLLLDLGMPEIDGFELISRIRASENVDVRGVPAAALTAFARAEDRTKALHSGFEMHLSKPIDPGELVASVITLVRRSNR